MLLFFPASVSYGGEQLYGKSFHASTIHSFAFTCETEQRTFSRTEVAASPPSFVASYRPTSHRNGCTAHGDLSTDGTERSRQQATTITTIATTSQSSRLESDEDAFFPEERRRRRQEQKKATFALFMSARVTRRFRGRWRETWRRLRFGTVHEPRGGPIGLGVGTYLRTNTAN